MPQDHASWDRKDLLRQRKHERSEQPFGSSFRWRNSSITSSSSHHVPREFSRWGSGEFRRPPGHGKQGGWHQFGEETGHWYAPSRSNARMFGDYHYRPSTSRGECRYNRNTRDGRVPFGQRDLKCHMWDMNDGSPSTFGRPHDMNNDRWSVDESLSHHSGPHTALVDSWNEANSMHQKVIDVGAPVEALKVNNDENLADQRPSLPLDARSLYVSFSEQPRSEDKHDASVYSTERQCHDVKCDQRSADDSALHSSNSRADLDGTWRHLRFNDQLDNRDGLKIAKQLGRESSFGSIDRKHPVWTQSGSFTTQGSGLSHLSSSKSLGAVDSSEPMAEFLPKKVIESPSGASAACLLSSYPYEEMNSRKKSRLGWGEGLAKYEKKKVEVPDANMSEGGTTIVANGTEEVHPLSTNLVDKSPSIIGVPDYGSPATPSSVACSSSPGMEDKSSGKSVNAANRASNLCGSPSPVHDNHVEGCHFNLAKLDNISVEKFGSLLNQLFLDDDSGLEDSSFVRLTAMNKVLTWKTEILKALEMTESEIDSLENEHRILKLEAGSHSLHLAGSSSILDVVKANVSEGDKTVETISDHDAGLDEVPIDASDGGVDSHEDVASTLSESSPLFKASSLSQCVAGAEGTGDSLEIPSIKTVASSSEVKMSAFANDFLTFKRETFELSSGGCSMVSDGEDELCATILASNSKSACEACEVFNNLHPREVSCIEGQRFFNVCRRRVDHRVRRKIEMRRRFLRVKERILVLKFKAFQYLWKKDLHQLSIAKYNPKSQKKCELSLHMKNSGHQKLPFPTLLRFSPPAAEMVSLPPTTDLIDYMGKLLLNAQCKPCWDILRMPALILDEKEKVMSRFMSSNGLVEDPCAIEKERTMINPWTSEERGIFLDKLAAYGKDFRKIASYLKQKTTADCIDFYYKNHKSDYFEKTRKKLAYGKEQKCTYMLAPQKKWKREVNAASLDLLGAVSVIAANASKVASSKHMSSKRITLGSCSSSKSHSINGFEGRLPNFGLSQRETIAADILAGVCGSLTSDPPSSCVRSSTDGGGKSKADLKLDLSITATQISDPMHNNGNDDDDDTCSEESFEQTRPIHWTDEERSAFIQAFSLYGKNFAMVSQCIGTRSRDQCKVFFSKVRKCLGLELLQPLSGNVSTSASADNGDDGGGSDMEDACVVGTSSRNDDRWTKMDMNPPTSPFNASQKGADHSVRMKLKTDTNRSGQENGMVYLRRKDNIELVDSSASLNGKYPMSEVGGDFIDVKPVESQHQAAQRIGNDSVVFTGTEEGTSSIAVSSGPSSCNPPCLANDISESFTERSRKDSESPSVALPKHDSPDQDSAMHTTSRISSDFGFFGCLHHVPIEVSIGDPLGVHLSRENSSTRPDSESPKSLSIHAEKNNLELGGKRRFSEHANHKQSDSKKRKVSNSKDFQGPRSSSMQNLNGGEMAGNIGYENHKEIKSRSKSDVGITTVHVGEGFPLRKCFSLTSNGSTPKHPRASHTEIRSGHCRSYSHSLSDTGRPFRTGDLKLFGTILASNDKGNHKQTHSPRQSVRTSTLKTSNGHNVTGNINQHDLRNVPITSYGFWDGNRIRTGFASLPNPAILLAKYPNAISNRLGPAALEQRVGNGNGSNGIVEIKQKQGTLSE